MDEDMFNYLEDPGFFCQFKDIFGYPRIGAHEKRIPVLDIAFTDTILTVIVAWVIYKYCNYTSYWKVLGVLILIGIIAHELFCVKTRLNMLIFNKV